MKEFKRDSEFIYYKNKGSIIKRKIDTRGSYCMESKAKELAWLISPPLASLFTASLLMIYMGVSG